MHTTARTLIRRGGTAWRPVKSGTTTTVHHSLAPASTTTATNTTTSLLLKTPSTQAANTPPSHAELDVIELRAQRKWSFFSNQFTPTNVCQHLADRKKVRDHRRATLLAEEIAQQLTVHGIEIRRDHGIPAATLQTAWGVRADDEAAVALVKADLEDLGWSVTATWQGNSDRDCAFSTWLLHVEPKV